MKVPELIKRELDSCGKPYQIVNGGQHQKIFVAGMFCGILPKNGRSNTNRAELNVRSQIRRAIKSLGGVSRAAQI